jgi:hypothetical protein
VEGSCEHGNEPSRFIKFWETLEQLSDWQLLKKDSDSWSYFVSYIQSLQISENYFTVFEQQRFQLVRLSRVKIISSVCRDVCDSRLMTEFCERY